jgi:Flp pilus assembly protein TadD
MSTPPDSARLAGFSSALAQHARNCTQALAQGRIEDARRLAKVLLAEAPEHPETLRLAATILILHGQAPQAVPMLERAAAMRPDDALIQHALAAAYEAVRDHTRAERALRRACELAPELPAYWFDLGRFLYLNGHIDAAAVPLQRTLELEPRHASAQALLASVLALDGRPREAEMQYRQIVDAEPASGSAWWGLATLTPMPLDAADIERMRAVLERTQLAEDDRIAIGYALAHALERQNDYPAAFAAFTQANARARLRKPWNAAEFSTRLHAIIAAFATSPAPPAAHDPGAEVIFIVSLPRSGSTLVEQVLASHSQIEGSAELADLPQIIAEESRRLGQPFPHWVATQTPERWRELGAEYVRRTQRWREHRPRSTDKMPGNWLYVGAIARMLPNARIVVVRRDPLETCFGCYRYLFHQHGYTHDFADLATAWSGFDRACRQWRVQLPTRVREQSYEELVTAPEAQIRALLQFCDLPFEENCLNFHATQRRVATASAGQVREPLRAPSARAGKYANLLDPLRAALRAAGYDDHT